MAETDPIKQLRNLCDFLESQKNDSPYSADAWDELHAENCGLRRDLTLCRRQLELALYNLAAAQEKLTYMGVK